MGGDDAADHGDRHAEHGGAPDEVAPRDPVPKVFVDDVFEYWPRFLADRVYPTIVSFHGLPLCQVLVSVVRDALGA